MNSLLALETATRQASRAMTHFCAVQWTDAGKPVRREMEAAQETLRLVRNAFEQELRQKCGA